MAQVLLPTGAVYRLLLKEGLPVTVSRLHHAVARRPITDIATDQFGNRLFNRKQIDQLREYLSNPRKRGRKPIYPPLEEVQP